MTHDVTGLVRDVQAWGAWDRKWIHELFRDVLKRYRDPTSEWARQDAYRFLQTLWDDYRQTWERKDAA